MCNHSYKLSTQIKSLKIEIVLIFILKLIALYFIWFFFFSHPQPLNDSHKSVIETIIHNTGDQTHAARK